MLVLLSEYLQLITSSCMQVLTAHISGQHTGVSYVNMGTPDPHNYRFREPIPKLQYNYGDPNPHIYDRYGGPLEIW